MYQSNWLRSLLAFVLTLVFVATSEVDKSTLSLKTRGPTKSRKSGGSRSETPRFRWERARLEDDDGAKGSKAKCVDIPQTMSLCRGIGYLKMRLPNLLEHETLAEVQHEATLWTPLLSTRCSPNTKLFLCSLFSPVCLDRPIWPCRSLCQEVKRGCEAPMGTHGYPWPEMLDCEKFPSDDDLCIGIQTNRSTAQDSTETQSHCKICENITNGVNNIMNNFCEAQFVARIKPEIAVINNRDLKVLPKKVKFYKNPTTSGKQKHRQPFFITDGAKCECFDLSDSSQYLVIGHTTEKQRLIVSSAVRLDVKSSAWRRAVRTMRRSDKCPEMEDKHQTPAIAELSRKTGKTDRKVSELGRKRKERKNSDKESHRTGNKNRRKEEKKRQRTGSNKHRNRNLDVDAV